MQDEKSCSSGSSLGVNVAKVKDEKESRSSWQLGEVVQDEEENLLS